MRHTPRAAAVLAVLVVVATAACLPPREVRMVSRGPLVVRTESPQDAAPKTELRLLPPEVYLRSYVALAGGTSPLDAQRLAKGGDGNRLFDAWSDYLSALGFPDHRLDLPRATQTNALMVAAAERLGVALCDRAVEHDLRARPPVPVSNRTVFAFELTPEMDSPAFAKRLDVLHRTFLGYPLALAPASRATAFFRLYEAIRARHRAAGAPRSRFAPDEAAWAAVCYALLRHPEFQLY